MSCSPALDHGSPEFPFAYSSTFLMTLSEQSASPIPHHWWMPALWLSWIWPPSIVHLRAAR
jgi:hypothetical protein